MAKTYFSHPDSVDLSAVDNAGRLAFRTNSNVITALEVTNDRDGNVASFKAHQLMITATQVVYLVDGKKKLNKMMYDKSSALHYTVKANTAGDMPVKDVNNLSSLMTAICCGNADLQGNEWFTVIANAYNHCKVKSDGSRQELCLDYWLQHLANIEDSDRHAIVSKLNFTADELKAIESLNKQPLQQPAVKQPQTVAATV